MTRKDDGPGLRLPGPSEDDSPGAASVAVIVTARTFRLEDLPPHIVERIALDPVSGCWRGTANLDKDGYSRFSGEGLHRIVWRLLVGEIPDGLVLDHVKTRGCRWNSCCNPAHLEPVTHRTNVLRGRSFAAVNARKDRCDHGHPFDLLNTYFYKNRRCCRRCNAVAVAEYKSRIRADRPEPLRRAA